MERLTILVGRLYRSVGPTKYFFKVQLVGRLMPLVGVICRPVESPLETGLLPRMDRTETKSINDVDVSSF